MLRVIRQGVLVSLMGLAAPGCGKKAEAPPDATVAAPADTSQVAAGDANVAATNDASVAAAGDANIAAPGDANMAAAGDANVAAPNDANAVAANDASVAAAGDASVAAAGDATVAAGDAADAKGSLEATCAAIAKVSDAAFAKVEAQKKASNGQADKEWPDLIPRAGTGACVKGPGGAWAIEVSDGTYHAGSAEVPGGSSEMTAKLVFVDEAGARTELAFDPVDGSETSNFAIGVALGQWWTVEAVHDWNGDGKAEVALRREHRSPEEQGSWIHLYRVGADEATKTARLERWLPLGDTTVLKVGDDDGDGRLDLFSFEGFARYVVLGTEFPTNPDGVYHFHHAKPDGTFESGGDAAKAYYRKACGPKLEAKDIPVGKDVTPEAAIAKAVCARLYGAKVPAIKKRIDPLLKRAFSVDEFDPAESWLAEVPVDLSE